MTRDFLTEECESCPGWGDFGRDSGECMYVYPGDHCEYARKVIEEKGENKPVPPQQNSQIGWRLWHWMGTRKRGMH